MVPEQSEEREPCSSVEPTGRTDTVSIPGSLVLLEVAERELSHERRWYHVIRHHVLRDKGVVSFFVGTSAQEEDDEMAEALVLQSDFGVSDGAVSAMYGVAHSINPEIRIFDLTHDMHLVLEYSDQVCLVQAGRIRYAGPSFGLLNQEQLLHHAHLKQTSLFTLAQHLEVDPERFVESVITAERKEREQWL